jgi:hypothetical protein
MVPHRENQMRHIVAVVTLLAMSISCHSQTPAPAKPDHPVTLLPTQKQAAEKAKEDSLNGGLQAYLHQQALIDDAVADAERAEIKAIISGHPELVAPEDMESCQKAIADAAKAKEEYDALQRDKARTDALLKQFNCPSSVQIGIKEICVTILMGAPEHTVDDVLYGKMLVFKDGTEVFLKDGTVTNITRIY